MITKQDLINCREAPALIELQNETIKQWQSKLARLEASSSLSRSTDKEIRQHYEELKQNIKDLTLKAIETANRLTQMIQEVTDLLDCLPNPRIRTVLYQRYLLGAEWDDISAILGISVRSAHRLHDLGLEMLEKMQNSA